MLAGGRAVYPRYLIQLSLCVEIRVGADVAQAKLILLYMKVLSAVGPMEN